MTYTFALCAGRHEIPGNPPAIFGNTVDPTDLQGMADTAFRAIPNDAEEIRVYVTGMTPATLAVANVCFARGITLVALHYNRETGDYFQQVVFRFDKCPYCGGRVPSFAAVCPHCGG